MGRNGIVLLVRILIFGDYRAFVLKKSTLPAGRGIRQVKCRAGDKFLSPFDETARSIRKRTKIRHYFRC